MPIGRDLEGEIGHTTHTRNTDNAQLNSDLRSVPIEDIITRRNEYRENGFKNDVNILIDNAKELEETIERIMEKMYRDNYHIAYFPPIRHVLQYKEERIRDQLNDIHETVHRLQEKLALTKYYMNK